MDFLVRILRPFLPRRFWYRRFYSFSQHWHRRAHQARRDAGFKCDGCGRRAPRPRYKTLDVHHKSYDRLWRERPGDLMVLCRSCHDQLHRGKDD